MEKERFIKNLKKIAFAEDTVIDVEKLVTTDTSVEAEFFADDDFFMLCSLPKSFILRSLERAWLLEGSDAEDAFAKLAA